MVQNWTFLEFFLCENDKPITLGYKNKNEAVVHNLETHLFT